MGKKIHYCQRKKELSPFLWNSPIRLHSSTESINCHCGDFQRDSAARRARTGASESLNVSAYHPVPSRVTGRVHHFVPTTVARQAKQLVPCVAWHDSFWHAWHPTSSQPSLYKWLISESQLGLLAEAIYGLPVLNKTLNKHWWQMEDLLRLNRCRDELL